MVIDPHLESSRMSPYCGRGESDMQRRAAYSLPRAPSFSAPLRVDRTSPLSALGGRCVFRCCGLRSAPQPPRDEGLAQASVGAQGGVGATSPPRRLWVRSQHVEQGGRACYDFETSDSPSSCAIFIEAQTCVLRTTGVGTASVAWLSRRPCRRTPHGRDIADMARQDSSCQYPFGSGAPLTLAAIERYTRHRMGQSEYPQCVESRTRSERRRSGADAPDDCQTMAAHE